ncbi:MAG: hypothetical protein CSA66_06865 [Proteobacteria bacterium]|nr:MAG: hypothetical protein CSA66_06865 [Pseudomonadota bacterium]
MHDKSAESAPASPLLTAARLGELLRARVPGAVLTQERVLRRAVRAERELGGIAPYVPHGHATALTRDALERLVDPDEIDAPLSDLPAWVYLIALPADVEALRDEPAPDVLRGFWRSLFHARIDGELLIRSRGLSLPPRRVLQLIDELGQTTFDEIRGALVDEALCVVDDDLTTAFIEFVALYSELRFFAPAALASCFPALKRRREAVDALVDGLIDGHALFEQTRPEGAAGPLDPTRPPILAADRRALDRAPRPLAHRAARRALGVAILARDRGNDARAAVLGALAASCPAAADDARGVRDRALASLGRRLSAAADGATRPEGWAAALGPLIAEARQGMKRVEARLLHDLQKACVAHEREALEVDLGRWLRSAGRRPARRPLPCQRLVDVARHLARARRRLPRARLAEGDRATLRDALDGAVTATESAARDHIGRLLTDALADARITPEAVPEQVASDKVVAELLDGLFSRGFIAFGDVRDALARNQLKLRDLAGPGELFKGDALLRLDRALVARLDGAYRRGEVYRRGLQRLSSIGFGNPVGRALVRFAALPFGAAFVVVEGLQHLVGPLGKWLTGHEPRIATLPVLLAAAALVFGLLHSATFRKGARDALSLAGDALRFALSTVPRWVRSLAPVDWLLHTRLFLVFKHLIWRPFAFAVPVALVAAAIAWDWRWAGYAGGGAFVVFVALLASRLGRRVEEQVADQVVRSWRHVRYHLLPGLFEATMSLFKATVDFAEVRLYQVDQWLRFRRGDGRVAVALKATSGLLWSILAYLFRFVINLLLEPQVNPIKHFPVVTVSHKLILPMTPQVITLYETFLPPATAASYGVFTVTAIPGIFGFLVWEFKENWRLYAANRKPTLTPTIVGSHGETVARLLRPGFHSGTVPKLLRKKRRAERRRRAADLRKHDEALHHVVEAMERFIERELVGLLAASDRFHHTHALRVEHVELTPCRITVDLACADLDAAPLQLCFDEQSRHLLARLTRRGWLDRLERDEAAALETALLGLYKAAGVDLVHEQIVSILPGRPPYDVRTRRLVVWPGEAFATEVSYPLETRRSVLVPKLRGPEIAPPPPRIPVGDLFFKRRPLPWRRWVDAWGPGQADPDPLRDLFGPLSVLDDDSLGNARYPSLQATPSAPGA